MTAAPKILHTAAVSMPVIGSVLCGTFLLWIFWQRWTFGSKRCKKQKVIAFFHPYCASGGGGERVLWAILQALGELREQGLPIKVLVYTVDTPSESYKASVLQKVKERFSISVPSSLEISFIHLSDCAYFLDRADRLSLIVESIGTMRLAYVALKRSTAEPPQLFFDTTGCAFTNLVAKVVFGCDVAAYTHYPTISTDMLSMVWERRRVTYNNQAYIARSRTTTMIKMVYYIFFAVAYGTVGSLCNLVLVNSTWTYNHIHSLWWLAALLHRIKIVFPPCRVPPYAASSTAKRQRKRERIVLSIGQFRPEKDHELQLEALSKLFEKHPELKSDIKMVMVGGCRGPSDQERLDHLQAKARQQRLESSVIFSVNQPYSVVEDWLRRASVGIHTMWNEHFGIGVVEMMAAGLITIAHDSGGPKSDIVVPHDGNKPTGLLASSAEEYADALYKAFTMPEKEELALRENARLSSARFSDEAFNASFKSVILDSGLLR